MAVVTCRRCANCSTSWPRASHVGRVRAAVPADVGAAAVRTGADDRREPRGRGARHGAGDARDAGGGAARAVRPRGRRGDQELLEARGVTLRTSSLPAMVARRKLLLAGGGEVFVDRVVTVPELEGPEIAGHPARPARVHPSRRARTRQRRRGRVRRRRRDRVPAQAGRAGRPAGGRRRRGDRR